MDDKQFRDLCALFAMQVFLKDDIDRREDKQMGRDWIAEQSFKVADVLVSERKNRDSR